MTYTILGHCGRTDALGIGVATYSLAVGGLCPAIRSRVGVVTSQAFVNPDLRFLGAHLLAAGYPAAQVLDLLVGADSQAEFRQIGVLDRTGRAAAHTGARTRPWTGHRIGPGHVALGNVLASGDVVAAISRGFMAHPGAPLAERLLAALEAGRDAGGQRGGNGHLPERSAALIAHGDDQAAEIDLRVDLHSAAVDELRRLYQEYRPYIALHRLRWQDPAKAPPQEQFVAEIEAERRRAGI